MTLAGKNGQCSVGAFQQNNDFGVIMDIDHKWAKTSKAVARKVSGSSLGYGRRCPWGKDGGHPNVYDDS